MVSSRVREGMTIRKKGGGVNVYEIIKNLTTQTHKSTNHHKATSSNQPPQYTHIHATKRICPEKIWLYPVLWKIVTI